MVGIVEEVGSSGVAYVTDDAFARAAGTAGRIRMLRIDTKAESSQARTEIIRAIEHELDEEHVSVEAVIPLSVLRTAMGTNVLERTREIGVMKTLGATPRQIARLVVGEALLVGGMSWAVAVALAVPLSALVGRTVGMLSFRVRLPLVIDLGAVASWLVLVAVVAVIATLLPARRASRLTIREALAHL